MKTHGRAYVLFGGPFLGLLEDGTLEGWERVAYERFAYDGIGGKGDGESAVYCKIEAQMTPADQQLHAKFGEPPQDWSAPLGWQDGGRLGSPGVRTGGSKSTSRRQPNCGAIGSPMVTRRTIRMRSRRLP
jgi:hypothetical protein